MVVAQNKDATRKVVLTREEKRALHSDLINAYNAGGRNLLVHYNKNLVNYMDVYDDAKNKVCKIVGSSAILLSEILGKSEDNVFMCVPISILSVVAEYCGGE